MFDFGPTQVVGTDQTNSPYHSESGSTEAAWNQVQLSDISSGLLFGDGSAATGVGINLGRTASGAGLTAVNLAEQPAGNLALGSSVNTGVYSGSSVGTDAIYADTNTGVTRGLGIQVTGLAAGTYTVYVTTRNTNTGAQTMATYLGTGTAGVNFDYGSYQSASLAFPTGSTTATGAWVLDGSTGENYVKFTVTLDGTQALNIGVAATATQTRGFINSLQIVPVPEPGLSFLAAFSALGLMLRRRRTVE